MLERRLAVLIGAELEGLRWWRRTLVGEAIHRGEGRAVLNAIGSPLTLGNPTEDGWTLIGSAC